MLSADCDRSTNQSNQPKVMTENGTRWRAKTFSSSSSCISIPALFLFDIRGDSMELGLDFTGSGAPEGQF